MTELAAAIKRPVFDRFVANTGDVAGLVAYAIYERDKRLWADAWHHENGGYPSPELYIAYDTAVLAPASLERYRQDANDVLVAFAEDYLESERPAIERLAVDSRLQLVAERIEASGSWWRQIPAGVVAAFCYTLLLVLASFVLKFSGIDFLSILSAVTKK